MSITATTGDLERGYEALRARAIGDIPAEAPRGLALLRGRGLVAWMRALPPAVPGPRTGRSATGGGMDLDGLDGELVSVLTEMAIGAGWGWRGAS